MYPGFLGKFIIRAMATVLIFKYYTQLSSGFSVLLHISILSNI